MKILLTKEMKTIITLEEAPIVNRIIKDFKEDESTAEYAEMAVNCYMSACVFYGGHNVKIFEASAEIAKNCRVDNALSENSKDFDIWINTTAKSGDCFLEIGAYLTDIWSISSDNIKEISSHMYVERYDLCKGSV